MIRFSLLYFADCAYVITHSIDMHLLYFFWSHISQNEMYVNQNFYDGFLININIIKKKIWFSYQWDILHLQIKQANYDLAFLCEYGYDRGYLLSLKVFPIFLGIPLLKKQWKKKNCSNETTIFETYLWLPCGIWRYSNKVTFAPRCSNVKYTLQLGSRVMDNSAPGRNRGSARVPLPGSCKNKENWSIVKNFTRDTQLLSFMDRVFGKFVRILKKIEKKNSIWV